MKHATPEMGRQFLDDPDLPFHEWAIPIGTHLLQRCPTCTQAVHEAVAAWLGVEVEDPLVQRHAFEFLYRRGVPQEELAKQARIDANELLGLPIRKRQARLAGEALRFRSPALVDELVERCADLVTRKAEDALEIAKLAVEISLRTDPDVVGDLAFHARARAEAHRGNCLRLKDDTHAAETAFRQAHELYDQTEIPDLEVLAELAYLEASLAMDQRRFGKSEELLERARDLYRRLDKPRSVALTWINHANLQYHRGRPAAGLPALKQAASLIDLEAHPDLHLTIRYSQALYAVEAGETELARDHYQEHRELLESRSEPWFALRLLWLRAKIARDEGNRETARDLYGRARDGFLSEGLGYDAAQVSLELALLHLETGDCEAVRRLAAEMLPIFQTQDVHREAVAALVLFERAARTEELTVDLTLRFHRYLQAARRDPKLRFEDFQTAPSEE